MKRDLISTIKIDAANLEFIAKNGKINGTLLIEIERVMTEYARQKANESDTGTDKYHIQNVTQQRELLSKFYRHLCDIAVIDPEYRTEYDKKTILLKFTL